MDLSLFAIGDVHLGRRPAGLPADLAELGVPPEELTPAAAWGRAVNLALERRVACVLLTGDVVESDNHWFEAYHPLEKGVRRLVDAGVGVYAVAGNHDVEALPRLAREIDGFHLLGRGGTWETARIGEALELLGWSFPERRVARSPLRDLDLPPATGALRVGLLHADLDASASPYAPVARTELARAPVDAWLLGHVHAPSLQTGPDGRPLGYLGSLAPLDPSERGAHGPWLLRAADGRFTCEHLPLAPLRWERLDVDVGKWTSPHDLEGALTRALLGLAERLGGELEETRLLGCRVHLVGRTRFAAQLREHVRATDASLRREVGDTVLFVERLVPAWGVDADLEALARDDTAPGLLARRLLALRGDAGRADEAADLLAAARDSLRRCENERHWLDLRPGELGDDELRATLAAAAEKALEELLVQAEARS